MGATTMMFPVSGGDAEEAYHAMLQRLAEEVEDSTWEDPASKPGYVRVWGPVVEPVDAEILARNIMSGRVSGNPWSDTERTSNRPKFGPWYVIQTGPDSWLFFGWVNT